MECLFSPCTRHRDIAETPGHLRPPEWLRELKLDVSTEQFLSPERAFTYADLYALIKDGETAAQLTPHACIIVGRYNGKALLCSYHRQSSFRFSFSADGKKIVALARSPEHLLEICDVVLRLLAASVVHSVILDKRGMPMPPAGSISINATSLAYLMEQCQSLHVLSLYDLDLDENHCRVLGAYSRPDLEIELIACKATSATTSTLAEVLGRNQGPHCSIVTNLAVRLYHTLIRPQSSRVCPDMPSTRFMGSYPWIVLLHLAF